MLLLPLFSYTLALATSLVVEHPSTSRNAADAQAATIMTLAKLTLAFAVGFFLLSAARLSALGLT